MDSYAPRMRIPGEGGRYRGDRRSSLLVLYGVAGGSTEGGVALAAGRTQEASSQACDDLYGEMFKYGMLEGARKPFTNIRAGDAPENVVPLSERFLLPMIDSLLAKGKQDDWLGR